MSYQVLARKYRPRTFDTLVGQEHVVKALTHALTSQRLHHAYLFTGTRGVGKTTISRILAKSLNCIGEDGKGGVTASPCGKCSACTEIDAGRFVDYLEMDAASNRGVDEMASLLEQAVYQPSVGRYKVYMIDEVHMLTNHAFNAMLKTLEEPPAHILFILATTDPQKIPVTVLSRCLQFNLKQMPPAHIVGHLEHVLAAESVPFEKSALRMIAQGAAGSMRDALSLTDQAIAYSAGNVGEEAVRAMLGTIDTGYLLRILEALAAGDAKAVVGVADGMAARSLSFSSALADLAGLLFKVSVGQLAAEGLGTDLPEREQLLALGAQLSPEEVQLHYQIALQGKADLPLAPDEQTGFTMTLLRMLAFRPGAAGAQASQGGASARAAARPQATAASPMPGASAQMLRQTSGQASAQTSTQTSAQTQTNAQAKLGTAPKRPIHEEFQDGAMETPMERASSAAGAVEAGASSFDGDWPGLVERLPITGFPKQLAAQSALKSFTADSIALTCPTAGLASQQNLEKLREAVTKVLGRAIAISVQVGNVEASATRAGIQKTEADAKQRAAEEQARADPFVQALMAQGAKITEVRQLP